MSVKLPRRPEEAESPPQHRDAGTVLALMFVLMVVAGFIGLVCLMMPDLIYGVLLLAGLAGTIAIHYFTWGRWLSGMKDETPDEGELKAES